MSCSAAASEPIPFEARVALPESERRRLEAIVAAQRTLEDVVRWGLAQTPPCLVADVVIQDEYTHDVLLPVGEGVVLVYDTT